MQEKTKEEESKLAHIRTQKRHSGAYAEEEHRRSTHAGTQKGTQAQSNKDSWRTWNISSMSVQLAAVPFVSEVHQFQPRPRALRMAKQFL